MNIYNYKGQMVEWLYLNPLNENNNNNSDLSDSAHNKLYFCPSFRFYMTPEHVVWFSRLCYSFALTSMSLSERPFLYDIMGGSLKNLI